MNAEIQKLGNSGQSVYRRRHVKTDGRDVYLYGYSPPDREPVTEELLAAANSAELRWHPLRKEWSIYAAARQNRTYKPSSTDDPLAPSRPGLPPTEIPFSDFDLAVFENRFPSLMSGAKARPSAPDDPATIAPADGRCEVIVYTPKSTGSLATLTQERRELLVHAWIDRYSALFALGNKFVLPFENRGDEVGVTLHHPHGQIYGFSFVPAVQQNAADAFKDGFDLEAKIKSWRKDYEIESAGGLSAFAPPFARFPYEVWLAPVKLRRGPWEFSKEEIAGFATLLGNVTRRYDTYFGRPCPYMLSLHAAPQGAGNSFHFTAQFYPLLRAPGKVKYLASVEQATNIFTVDVLPEQVAAELKKI